MYLAFLSLVMVWFVELPCSVPEKVAFQRHEGDVLSVAGHQFWPAFKGACCLGWVHRVGAHSDHGSIHLDIVRAALASNAAFEVSSAFLL